MRGCTAAGGVDDTQYSRPLPWIGVYVAAASAVCAAAMAFDACSGLRRRNFWFHSRLFSLNATTLTLLGITSKFPLDLNTSMPGPFDQVTKLSGTVLICTAMGNFMASLGSMDKSDALSNVVALGILVVTVVVNVCIQMGTGVIYVFLPEHAIIMFLMMLLLVIFVSTALTVAPTRQMLEEQYYFKYQRTASDDGSADSGNMCTLRQLKESVMKYWLMEHTRRPQYGRWATCTTSGVLCIPAAGVLTLALLKAFIKHSQKEFCSGISDYQWSTPWVLVAQVIAVLIGTIAPVFRCFVAAGFWSSGERRSRCRDELKVEMYWVQSLNEWKGAPLPFHISSRWGRMAAHGLKNSVMGLLITLQVGVVLLSKLVWLVTALILPVSSLFSDLESISTSLHDYVLYLEGEDDFVKLIARLERTEVGRCMGKCKGKQPVALLGLIKSCSTIDEGFKGVGAFQSDDVPSLVLDGDPPNCWALPVATLASIAAALPGINQCMVNSLINGVTEGLRFVRFVENTLDARGLVNMRKAADKIWLDVDIYDRWFNLPLSRSANRNTNGKEAIEIIRDTAKEYVLDFVVSGSGASIGDPLQWPEKVLAANCMYRVCTNLLQDYDSKHRTDDNLFAWLRRTISDMLGACLTNLPHAIHMECVCCPVEQRERRVRNAVFLLGEAESILQILESPGVAGFFPREMVYIDEWRGRGGSLSV